MSRHRDVRNMDYSEDYDGYDDVYGHSVDDDYYISPTNTQFMFNRDNPREQPKIAEVFRTEQDIQEEDESETMDLSELDKAKLDSCLNQIKATLGPLSILKNDLVNIIITCNFNIEHATNTILKQITHEKEKDVGTFCIAKLDTSERSFKNIDNFPTTFFNNLFCGGRKSNSFVVPKLLSNETTLSPTKLDSSEKSELQFSNLSDLVAKHLNDSLKSDNSFELQSSICSITTDIDNLKINRLSHSNLKIDLSVALKATSNGNIFQKCYSKEEYFEIPFVDCDIDLEASHILKCSFDLKNVLNEIIPRTVASHFGKIVCRRYRRSNRYLVIRDTNTFKINEFQFVTLSPDDSISKHLNRH